LSESGSATAFARIGAAPLPLRCLTFTLCGGDAIDVFRLGGRGRRSLGEPDFHENLTREDELVGSSDRVFGLTVAAAGAAIGALKLWQGHGSAWLWLAAAAAFFCLALFWAAPLRRLNRLWMRFGLILYRVVNPVVVAVLFFATVVPMGLAMRAFGRDALRLKLDKSAASYWILREPPGPSPETMKFQF